MDLPVKFPSETEVILEDVVCFRSGSSPGGAASTVLPRHAERFGEQLMLKELLRRAKVWLDLQYSRGEQERLTRRGNIREFIARHAH